MHRIGARLVEEKKREAMAAASVTLAASRQNGSKGADIAPDASQISGKDLLSVLGLFILLV